MDDFCETETVSTSPESSHTKYEESRQQASKNQDAAKKPIAEFSSEALRLLEQRSPRVETSFYREFQNRLDYFEFLDLLAYLKNMRKVEISEIEISGTSHKSKFIYLT